MFFFTILNKLCCNKLRLLLGAINNAAAVGLAVRCNTMVPSADYTVQPNTTMSFKGLSKRLASKKI